METQRILMRSLAVVFFTSVIWTITAGAQQKVEMTCCEDVSRLTREDFPDPIIGFRMLKRNPPCLKAVVFKTERGEFCFDWRQPWVQKEQSSKKQSLTSTPPPASSISKLTPEDLPNQLTDQES
ncbi:chemokine CCL-CUa [Pimephales promelas]|nr:chemokine CCL-CUa [Pimephales promelas]